MAGLSEAKPRAGSKGRSPWFGIANGGGHITYLLAPRIESDEAHTLNPGAAVATACAGCLSPCSSPAAR